MNNTIIENILFDKKVTDNFYVIKDKEKQDKNTDFIRNNFDFVSVDEGYEYALVHLEFEKNLFLSFSNLYGFKLDFIILNSTSGVSKEVKHFLSKNVENEIRITTLAIYEDSFDF